MDVLEERRTAIYVNLFVGGRTQLGEVAGTPVEVVQATRYPWAGQVRLTINPATPATFVVRIRSPRRDVSSLYSAVPRADGPVRVAVNGVTIAPTVSPAKRSAQS